ncbi:MAG: HAMP domain-containing sensor histidine kinase [Bacteroidota bacterium]
MKLAKIIDYFIHPYFFSQRDELRQRRLLIKASLLTSLFSNTYIWLSLFFEYEKGVYFMIFNVVGFLILPFFTKTRIPNAVLGNIFVGLGGLAVIALTYFSGGLWSAIYPWIISIPVLALLVVNRASAYVWGTISLLVMISFGIATHKGYQFPVEYNTELRALWYLFILPGLLLIILVIAFVFEYIQSQALQALKAKNQILKSQKSTISAQSRELEQLIEEKDYIIRILAHDLKNPLGNITSLIHLMKIEEEGPEKNKYINMINQSSMNAQNLVNKVLEMDVSDRKNISLQMELVNVIQVLDGVTHSMSEMARKKGINININDSSTRHEVKADKTYFPLIFENLISNAIKFSQPDKSINLNISNDNQNIQVKVTDEGPGIHPDEQNKLFKKFSKLSARPTAGESSTGLGLSLAKRYVDLMGGKIWYESGAATGATFVVELGLAI